MNLAQFFGSGIGLILIVVVVIWAVLWFFVPFMVNGINNKLKALNKTNTELLKAINRSNVLLENVVDKLEPR